MDFKTLKGLLGQYFQDAAPGGLLNPEVPPGGPTELAKGLLGFTPGVGDAISAYDAVQSARQGDMLGAALNGVGVLPFVPSMAGTLKGADLKAAVLKQATDGWRSAIGDTGEFVLKKMYPVTIDLNGRAINFGASKASGAGPLTLTRLADTKYGPQFIHYKLSKDGDLIENGTQNLFAMSPDVMNEHINHFKGLFNLK